jgi:hypothetical protein
MELGAPDQPVPSAKAVSRGRSRVSFWQDPKFGLAEAVVTMGTTAAPLLAGFSLSTFVLVLTLKARDARYRGAAALLLLLAAVLLVLAVQATISARGWRPYASQPSGDEMSKGDQEWLTNRFTAWSIGATIAYDLGLLCLLASLTVLAVPPVSKNPAARWAAVAVGAAAFMVTFCWTIAAFWQRRHVFPALGVQVRGNAVKSHVPGYRPRVLGPLAGAQAQLTDGHQAWNPGRARFLPIAMAGQASKTRPTAFVIFRDGKVHERVLDGNETVGAAQSEALKFNLLASPPAAPQPQPAQEDTAATLRKLADLHRTGLLTDEEYIAKSAEVIART